MANQLNGFGNLITLKGMTESIAKCIYTSLDYVVRNPEKLISQSYDSVNVMSGHHVGEQTIV